jgi:predicted acetyltransferase
MQEIKPLAEQDFAAFATIVANAYPSFKIATEEDRQRLVERFRARSEQPTNHVYGLYRDGTLYGGMILYDFTIKLLSVKASAGGVGLVAVDILHKKEKVARDMIAYFLQHYKAQGATLTTLYPFRPDFYKQMGFGFGTKMSQYRVRPSDLPKGATKQHIVFLRAEDKELLRDCYHRYLERTHGMMERSDLELSSLFNNQEHRIVAYKRDDRVQGYMVFTFKPGSQENFNINDILVRELVYETREALSELFAFLHSQADQIRRVIFQTQDEDFHHALRDPRNGTENLFPSVYHESNIQGVGIMYRVIDTKGIFGLLRDHNFGNQDCKLKLALRDSFLAENDGSTVVHFRQGRPALQDDADYDIEVGLDIADFSSLLMGAVRFKSLYMYGLADISDERAVDTVDRLFMTEAKPICMTPF